MIAEMMVQFRNEVMPRTRQAIKEHRKSFAEDWQRERRIEYLMGKMEEEVYHWLCLMDFYDEQKHRDMANRVFLGDRILHSTKAITKIQREIIALKRLNNGNGITDDMIERAREYPFEDLLPALIRGRCKCPIHEGENTMSFSVKNNQGHCFSCHWHGDTIRFLQDTEGLTFQQAVRRLS